MAVRDLAARWLDHLEAADNELDGALTAVAQELTICKSQRDELLAVLRQGEWAADEWGSRVECPWCKRAYFTRSPYASRKHRDDCAFLATIAKAEGGG